MLKTNLTIALVTVGLLAGAPAAHAVSLGVHGGAGVGASAKASTPAANVGASSNANLGASANTSMKSNANAGNDSYGTVVSALASNKGTSIPANISSTTDVTIVSLSSLKGKASANAKVLAQLTKKRASTIAKLDASIAANAQLKAKLTDAGYQASDVVAVKTAASGAITLFVNG